MLFAALQVKKGGEIRKCGKQKLNFTNFVQLQVGLQANVPQPSEDEDAEDDVDAALNDLQV